MQKAQGVEPDGSLRASRRFDTFMMREGTVHAGPEHDGHRAVLFLHICPETLLGQVEPFTQVSAATVIHEFCDTADNQLGDRALLQWAEHKPWLQLRDTPMWEKLCESLLWMQETFYNDPEDTDFYIDPDLLSDLRT